MIWIDPTNLPDDTNLNWGTQQSTPGLEQSSFVNADFNGTLGLTEDVGVVLPFTVAIDESVGGTPVPANMLGWSTGFVPAEVRWAPFNGATLVGSDVPNSAVIFASEQYGDVGLSTANQTKVEQINYLNNVFTPNDENAAATFIAPGFEVGM